MVSTEKNFIFVHIRKTGGNSIQSVLSEYAIDEVETSAQSQDGDEQFDMSNEYGLWKHAPLREYKGKLPEEEYEEMFKFSVVRNPWERLVSMYFTPSVGREEWDRDEFLEVVEYASTLREYICVDSVWDRAAEKVGLGSRGDLQKDIDFLIRFEQINEDFRRVCDMLDLGCDGLPEKNSSDRKHYSEYYDEELVSIVGEKFQEEIEEFGYEFEGGRA
jgi:hypothetical protein